MTDLSKNKTTVGDRMKCTSRDTWRNSVDFGWCKIVAVLKSPTVKALTFLKEHTQSPSPHFGALCVKPAGPWWRCVVVGKVCVGVLVFHFLRLQASLIPPSNAHPRQSGFLSRKKPLCSAVRHPSLEASYHWVLLAAAVWFHHSAAATPSSLAAAPSCEPVPACRSAHLCPHAVLVVRDFFFFCVLRGELSCWYFLHGERFSVFVDKYRVYPWHWLFVCINPMITLMILTIFVNSTIISMLVAMNILKIILVLSYNFRLLFQFIKIDIT